VFAFDYWRRFLKFNVVGVTGVVVNEGLLVLLASSGVYYLYASAVAIELSIVSNFILNDLWTFRDRRHGHVLARMGKFNGLMLVGLVVNLAILYAGTDYLGVNYAVSNLAGIAVAFLVRYWLSVRYAWIKKETASAEPTP
jgi:dolichol-phosphate mannosyltransferase